MKERNFLFDHREISKDFDDFDASLRRLIISRNEPFSS